MIASCNALSRSLSTARASAAREPKRRNSVPLPTPAAAATSSIETHVAPRSANSR